MNTLSQAVAEPRVDPKEVLSKALLNTANALGITQADLAQTIGRNRTTIHRGIDPQSKTGEMALMLIRCYRALHVLVGGKDEEIKHWFHTANHHLGGEIPATKIKTVQGLAITLQYLDAIRGKL
ncbi:MAG: antitoxin Xre/MbcA/ParS toxin-binding domain-containing protein [Halopseudomonas sp.]